MLGPLWLRVKPYLAGRNGSATARPAPPDAFAPRADVLDDLRDQFKHLETTLASEDVSPADLRGHFRNLASSLNHLHAALNEGEAQFNHGLKVVEATRRTVGDSKERIALTLARIGHIELVRALFDDPEGLEADLYVDHIERRAAEAQGPVPAPDLKRVLPRGGAAGGQAGPPNDPDPGDQPN